MTSVQPTGDRPEPDVSNLDPESARRVRLTVSCKDCDDLPRVANAGQIELRHGSRVQIMHNGVVVEEGGYFGPWMDEIIRALRGHHEPQEELVVARVLERLARDEASAPCALELGSFWAYYSLWFLEEFPAGIVIAMEPDPDNLELGRRNFTLNGKSGHFVAGVIGPSPGEHMTFVSELRGTPHDVVQHDLASLMAVAELERVDLVMCDIQGAEALFVDQAAHLLTAGRVRFLIISTHHHSISGNPLTHQLLLARLCELGAHIVAEHTVGESFSGDGLIAVSFDDRDRDLVVSMSIARQGDSLFGDVERDLARTHEELAACRSQMQEMQTRSDEERARHDGALHAAREQLDNLHATRLWRYTHRPRALYSSLRHLREGKSSP